MANNHRPSENEGSDGDPRAALLDLPPIASGRRLGSRYVLERPLGYGGMAVVWLATDERLQRPVAIKVLSDTLAHDDEYLVRFRREARVAAGLQHPNLVGVYDFDAGARPYLVMEYVSGGDLGECLEAGKAPEPGRLARELLAALRRIHAAGVLHRDIKPQNVLLDADRRARLTDFGIAQPQDAASLTRTGRVIGTERYIAPEVMAGEAASERSDLFALGVVLAEAADGGGDAALRALIDRLRDPDPAGRPASTGAALAELERRPTPGIPTQPYAVEELEPTEPWPATDETAPYRPFEPTMSQTRRGRRRWAVAALAVVALAAAAALAISLATGDGSGGGAGGSGSQAANRGAAERPDEGDAAKAASGREAAAAPADTAPAPTTDESTAAAPSASAPAASGSAPAPAPSGSDSAGAAPSSDAASLNDQGYALVQDERYEEAIPILEQAVEGLDGSGDDQTYNYALYNLATAYLGAGRAEEAIPLLEERMRYDDGQLDTVQATLDEAYAAAGQQPPGEDVGEAASGE